MEDAGAPPKAQPMTPLDLGFLARELRAGLRGGVITKAYQYGKSGSKQLLLEASCPGGARLLYWDPSKAFLTESKKPIPVEPPNFCLFLRRHLMGQKILDIRQYRFGSVLEIVFRDHILILEFLPPGNAILCDSSYNIIMPLEIQRLRNRVVRPREVYRHPGSGDNPLGMDFDGFHRLLHSSGKELGAVLSMNLGFGPVYSGELCLRAGLDCGAPAREVVLMAALKLFNVMKPLLDMEASPVIYQDMVSPFPLQSRKDKPASQSGSFSRALDEFFSGQPLLTGEKGEETRKAEAAGEMPRPVPVNQERQPAVPEKRKEIMTEAWKVAPDGLQKTQEEKEEAVETQKAGEERKWDRISRDSGEEAELIRENLPLVESILGGIRGARESGLSWGEIRQRVMGEQSPEALAIREIREGDAVVVMELGGKAVELDFRLGAEENAEKYQEDMEWAKGKLGMGGKPVPENPEAPAGEKIQEAPKKRRRKWFEKFFWFLSSDGFLVIGGKDTKQNEMIMGKYMEPGDLVFHADMPGASLVVISSKGREIPAGARKEAAELAAATSRPWSGGMGKADIFCVRPGQVSRAPPPGEYLPRGSFLVTREREWFRDLEVKLSIGIVIDREKGEAQAISGPVMAVRTHSDYFVTIMPGYKRSLELARDIKNSILIKASPEDKFIINSVPLEDIQRLIPQGSGDIVEWGA